MVAAKVVYLRILPNFARFRVPKGEYKSRINFHKAVPALHDILVERYDKPKSTIAHLISSLVFQLFNEIEHEEVPNLIDSLLHGKVMVTLDENNKSLFFKVAQYALFLESRASPPGYWATGHWPRYSSQPR
ncbi:hypothetical protein ACFLXG_04120 [Chloroflexota bacterium]